MKDHNPSPITRQATGVAGKSQLDGELADLLARVEAASAVLSIRQPWAWLIVNGHKDIENRDWPTNRTGDVLIHAGKAWGPDERETMDDLRAGYNPADYRELSPPIEGLPDKPDLGGIVGIARIHGCVAGSDSRWFVGNYGFMLRDAAPLPFVPSRGQLGFYPVAAPDRAALLKALSHQPPRAPDEPGDRAREETKS